MGELPTGVPWGRRVSGSRRTRRCREKGRPFLYAEIEVPAPLEMELGAHLRHTLSADGICLTLLRAVARHGPLENQPHPFPSGSPEGGRNWIKGWKYLARGSLLPSQVMGFPRLHRSASSLQEDGPIIGTRCLVSPPRTRWEGAHLLGPPALALERFPEQAKQ